MPNTDRDIVDRAIDTVRERVDRIREDVGNALDGSDDVQIFSLPKRNL
jgi:hypothetical protein